MTNKIENRCADVVPARLAHSPLREGASWALARVASSLHAVLGDRQQGAPAILMYHRVAEQLAGLPAPTINVTPTRLREQLAGLLDRGFQAWPLEQLLSASELGSPIPAKVFTVTFDDGFENNLTDALPILTELKVPATIFLATAFLDSPAPFPNDNWPAAGSASTSAKTWRPLTSEQCRQLQASGLVTLGAHTHTHQFFLDRVNDFQADLQMSVDILRDRFGVRRPTFSFPFGLSSPELIASARKTGVRCGLTTRPDCVTPGSDPFRWGRFGATTTDTAGTLAAKLAGWYSPLASALRTAQRPLATLGPRRLREHLRLRNPSFAFLDEKSQSPRTS